MNRLTLCTVALVLVGCAASTDELYTAARQCDEDSRIPAIEEDSGVVKTLEGVVVMEKDPTACQVEWAEWNKADERHTKALARRKADRNPIDCGDGKVLWCNADFGRKDCFCVFQSDVREAMRRHQAGMRRVGRH
jgi:hypothetical protein